MKKIILLGFILTLFVTVVSAQQTRGNRLRHHREMQAFRHGQLNRSELRHLHHDELRYKIARRGAHRDGMVTPFERRRLTSMKRDQRRDLYRFRHNNRRRVI